MAYNTTPTACYGSLNQDLNTGSTPVGTWQTVPNVNFPLTANDGTTTTISSHFAKVSYTPICTVYYPCCDPILDPWGVDLNHASPNDGYNVEMFSTYYQLDAVHQNNNTVKAHPELNNQLHDWHIDNGTIPSPSVTDFLNALGLLGNPATGFGTAPQTSKIYPWDPGVVGHESVFPYGTQLVCLGSSDTLMNYGKFIGWGQNYGGHIGSKAFCNMYSMFVQSQRSTATSAFNLSHINTRIHATSGGGSQVGEFGSGVWHLRISGLRHVGTATKNSSGTWNHEVQYGTSTWMRFGPVKMELQSSGTPSGTPSGGPYAPIARPNPCWVVDSSPTPLSLSGKASDNFSAEEVTSLPPNKYLGNVVVGPNATIQNILTNYGHLITAQNVFVDAWNTIGGYFPLDAGYSNGDQLLIVASLEVQQGPVRVSFDNTGVAGIAWDSGTKISEKGVVKDAAMNTTIGSMTYTCAGSPGGPPPSPGGTPASTSSTQSPAPPVSPVGPITQPSPASYPTSGGSILLLHSDQNPPIVTPPTPADFFNNGLAALGPSRMNHVFSADMLSNVVLTNNSYNTIFYYLMDAAQNIEYLGSVTFYVDRDKPTGGITDPKGANWLPPYTAEWLGKNKPAPFDGSINVCDEPSTGGGTNTNILYPPPAPVPTYAISATTDHPNPLHNNLIHEGSLVSTFTITTTDVPDGTVLYWTSDTPSYAPVTANDFTDNTLQGSVTIIGNSAVITRQALADNLTEGPETFRLQLRTDSVTGYIVASSNYIGISDTSKTILPPPPTYAISVTTDKPGYNKSLSEGSYKATFVVTTTDVPDGTVLYWKTYTTSAGLTNAQDFADNATQGTLTINGNTGTIIREAVADSITEGPESFRIDIHIDSFGGLIVAQSDWIGIEDTSQTPPPPPPPTYNIAGTTTHATYKNTVVDEASEASVTYNVTTTNVPDGTILYWTHEPRLTAPQPSDFKDGMDRGSVTISGNSGIITRQIFADNTLEGPEVLRLELRTVSVTGSIVARSNFIAISDTSS